MYYLHVQLPRRKHYFCYCSDLRFNLLSLDVLLLYTWPKLEFISLSLQSSRKSGIFISKMCFFCLLWLRLWSNMITFTICELSYLLASIFILVLLCRQFEVDLINIIWYKMLTQSLLPITKICLQWYIRYSYVPMYHSSLTFMSKMCR